MSPSTEPAPTARQLRYLRNLAVRTGTTFTYPATRSDASHEIARLRGLGSDPATHSLEGRGPDAESLVYATAPHPSEISGFGSSATWRVAPPRKGDSRPPRQRVAERPSSLDEGQCALHRTRDPAPTTAVRGPARTARNATKPRGAAAIAAAPNTRTVRDRSADHLTAGGLSRLGRYATPDDAGSREIVGLAQPDGSTLLVDLPADSLAGTLDDARLIARLAPDEPSQNAELICAMYLGDDTRGRCRRLAAADLVPPGPDPVRRPSGGVTLEDALVDARGGVYLLRAVPSCRSRPELRWTRSRGGNDGAPFDTVVLRDVVAALEDYEPARAITAAALATACDGHICTRRLRVEATRLACSPIVLNRRLREIVEARVAVGVSMSEIAMRCERMKHDRNGNRSGETTWLARRIGQMPEGGKAEPTPWVHIDTLALIAREGLGIAPHEVEL